MGLELKQIVEAVLFAAPKPLNLRQIFQLLQKGQTVAPAGVAVANEINEEQVEAAVRQLQAELAGAQRGFQVQEIAGGYRLGTLHSTAPWVRQMFDETKPSRLSQPALETLSIIAYRQPISRADIEAVRGVAVDGVVATLLERRLLKLAGRSEGPGKPLLYETTAEFLECFGLKGLDELPNADELRRIPIRTIVTPEPTAPQEETKAGTPPEEAVLVPEIDLPIHEPAEYQGEDRPTG